MPPDTAGAPAAYRPQNIPTKPVIGRFSEGIEHQPDSPDRAVTRRFSEGIEHLPDSPDKAVTRRFSEGIESAAIDRARDEYHHA